MFNSAKTIAEQKERISTLEAELTAANTARDAAEARVTEFEAKANEATAAHESAVTALKAEHAAALAAKDAEADARVQREVTDALASAGVPEASLPARSQGPASKDFDAQIEDLNARIAEAKDPLEKGKLASQVLDIMAKKNVVGLN